MRRHAPSPSARCPGSLIALLLGACGGQPDDPPQAVDIDTYAGTWLGTCVPLAGLPGFLQSARQELQITPLASDRLRVESNERLFQSPNCDTGLGNQVVASRQDELAFLGKENVDGTQAERWQGSIRDGVTNPLLRIEAVRLYGTGAPPASDANGQPAGIDPLHWLTRS
jgi:hypothetical protein